VSASPQAGTGAFVLQTRHSVNDKQYKLSEKKRSTFE
jgi:hypothetical protein